MQNLLQISKPRVPKLIFCLAQSLPVNREQVERWLVNKCSGKMIAAQWYTGKIKDVEALIREHVEHLFGKNGGAILARYDLSQFKEQHAELVTKIQELALKVDLSDEDMFDELKRFQAKYFPEGQEAWSDDDDNEEVYEEPSKERGIRRTDMYNTTYQAKHHHMMNV